MKKYFIIAIAAALACSCNKSSEPNPHEGHEHHHEATEHEHHHDHEHEAHEHGAEAHKHNGEIQLHDEVAERFGVKVDTVRPGSFYTIVSAGGQVMNSSSTSAIVSAPTSGIVHLSRNINAGSKVARGSVIATIDARGTSGGDANALGAATLEAARREYERIETLYKEQLATIGERNSALAAYEEAKASYSPAAASGRASAPISGTITAVNVRQGQFVGTGEALASIASSDEINLRIDIPQRYYAISPSLNDAVLTFAYLDAPVRISAQGGHRQAAQAMPADGAASSFVPIYFTMPNRCGIIPGSTFTAKLTGTPRADVITVPVEALSEQQGEFFVYERVHPESYIKRRVTIGQSDGERVEITGGITAGTPIVVAGTTSVRLAESGTAVPEGHTHNH